MKIEKSNILILKTDKLLHNLSVGYGTQSRLGDSGDFYSYAQYDSHIDAKKIDWKKSLSHQKELYKQNYRNNSLSGTIFIEISDSWFFLSHKNDSKINRLEETLFVLAYSIIAGGGCVDIIILKQGFVINNIKISVAKKLIRFMLDFQLDLKKYMKYSSRNKKTENKKYDNELNFFISDTLDTQIHNRFGNNKEKILIHIFDLFEETLDRKYLKNTSILTKTIYTLLTFGMKKKYIIKRLGIIKKLRSQFSGNSDTYIYTNNTHNIFNLLQDNLQ